LHHINDAQPFLTLKPAATGFGASPTIKGYNSV